MPSRTLQRVLIESDPARLEAIARRWGIEDLPGRRREAADVLAARILAPEGLEQMWASLSAGERTALTSLQAAGGTVPWLTFTRRWGEVRPMGPGRMARERPWETPASPTEGLWYRGLLFRTALEGPSGLFEAACIPDEMVSRLPAPTLSSPPQLEPTTPPLVVRPANNDILDDACTLLAYLQNHQVRPQPEGEWPAQDEAGLARRLRQPSLDRLAFLRHLVARQGCLRTDRAGYLRPAPGPAAEWLQAPASEQRAALARVWQEDPTWNDLWHVPTLRPDDTGSWCNDPLLARRAILRHLSACHSGEWYSLAAFVVGVKETDPDFQRPDGDYSTWYIRDLAAGTHLSGFESWDAVEGALIRFLLTGPMAWLGLVDLGAESEGEPPVTFRLSPAGSALLGFVEEKLEVEQKPPPFTIRPDLVVLAPAVCRYERFQLSRVADWVRTDDPYVYRLTSSSLERARRQKITPERVKAFMEQAAGGDTPYTLAPAVDRWSRRGSEVQLERGVLLRVREEGLLRELAAAPPIRRLIREVVGPTAALVAPSDWPRLVRALVEEGLLPSLMGLEDEDPR